MHRGRLARRDIPDYPLVPPDPQQLPRPTRADRPRDGRLLRSGLEGHSDARAQQPDASPDQTLRGPPDRAALVHDPRRSGPAPLRPRAARQPLPGAGGGDGEPLRRRRPRALAMSAADDDAAISYKLLAGGTPIHSSDGVLLGTVDRVLDNEREQIFDGIVMRAAGGERFVDAPEVARITERRVTLSIDADDARELPAYVPGAPEYRANPKAGRLGRFLGGGWKKRERAAVPGRGPLPRTMGDNGREDERRGAGTMSTETKG